MKRVKVILFVVLLVFIHDQVNCQSTDASVHFDKVVIDAGHGGNDLGGLGSLSQEKDIALSIALKLGSLIENNLPGVKVVYTRKDDRFVPLHKRAKIANDNHADLFISVHCNSNPNHDVFGAETYVMGIHKSMENLDVAKTENAVILLEENYLESYDGFNPDLDEDYIMLNMVQSVAMEQSIQFSARVQDHMMTDAHMYDRGVKQAGFVVLYLTAMPGVLIETGFLSNPAEEQQLLDIKNQISIARAIFEAVVDYKFALDEEHYSSSGEIPLK